MYIAMGCNKYFIHNAMLHNITVILLIIYYVCPSEWVTTITGLALPIL